METLLYAKYFVAFSVVVLSFSITFQLLSKIADFLIATLMLGAAAVVCFSIRDGHISSWTEVTGVSILFGVSACLVCIPLIPFSNIYRQQNKESSTLNQSTPAKSG